MSETRGAKGGGRWRRGIVSTAGEPIFSVHLAATNHIIGVGNPNQVASPSPLCVPEI